MPIDPARLDHFMGWDGPVGRSFRRRIDAFEALARSSAPIRHGYLEASIGHVLLTEGNAIAAFIGTNPDQHVRGYAIIVHRGSKPHEILPHKPPNTLKFRVAGRLIYAQRVNHPGTSPDPFLTRWIRELTR